jgi:hypothetical protein
MTKEAVGLTIPTVCGVACVVAGWAVHMCHCQLKVGSAQSARDVACVVMGMWG